MSLAFDFEMIFYDQDFRRDNFTAQLLKLIAKADPINMARIERGFPKEVAVYRAWMEAERPPRRDELSTFVDRVVEGVR